jgi:hypothetical protein
MKIISIIKDFVYYCVKGLRPHEKAFVELNSMYWKQECSSSQKPQNKFVYVLKESYPLILIGNIHVSSMIAVEHGLKLLLLVPSHLSISMRKVVKSFPNVEIIYEDSPGLLIARILSIYDALKTLLSFKTPDDVLSYECDGIRFGDLIYDSYLTLGYSTMRKVFSIDLFKILCRFYYGKKLVSFVLKNYDVKVLLAGHMCDCIGGTLVRYFVKNNIEIWERWVTMKKHKTIDTLYDSAIKPEMKYVNYLKQNKSQFIPLAEKHLNDRLGNRTTDYGAELPYQKDKQVFISKSTFCNVYNLDSNKKNIFVMMHAFTDYPNTFGFSIYRDYYQWFKAVLNIAKQDESVNWIFKEHPGAKYYPTKDINLKTIFDKFTTKNIRFIDANANFNTSSLRYVADVICTCMGSAGLEYSAFGIPCVLGGKSWYAGFGFTIEPKNEDEFVETLKNIITIERLNIDQTDMAKIIAYLTFAIFDITNLLDPFCTMVTFDADAQKNMSMEQIFETIVTKRNNSSVADKTKYNKAIKEFINNPDCTQFIDLEKHTYFRF